MIRVEGRCGGLPEDVSTNTSPIVHAAGHCPDTIFGGVAVSSLTIIRFILAWVLIFSCAGGGLGKVVLQKRAA